MYTAKTFGDFDGLLDDLPGTVPPQHAQVQPVAPAAEPVSPDGPHRSAANQFARWGGPYGGVILVCVLIWLVSSLASGHLLYFWPVWMLIPLILGVLGQWGGGSSDARTYRADSQARKAARRARKGRS